MRIFSTHWTIHTSAAAAILDPMLSARGDAFHSHPPRTLLEVPDEEAERLVERGIAIRYDRSEHGDDLRVLNIDAAMVKHIGDQASQRQAIRGAA